MSELQLACTNCAGISTLTSFWVFVASNLFGRWRQKLTKLGYVVLFVSAGALVLALVERGVEAQRFPLANLYESLLWFALATMGGYLVFAKLYQIEQLGWLASLIAATMFLYGSWLPPSQHEITPLVPALVSYWRQIHVPPLIFSYAMFFLSGLAALLELFYAGKIRSLVYALLALVAGFLAVVLGTFTDLNTWILQGLFVGGGLAGLTGSWLSLKTTALRRVNEKSAQLYDEVGYRTIAAGLPLLTIGIITGGLWANHAWGTYWSWDPKESMALTTWLSYAAYIHLRVHKECSKEQLSLVAIASMLLTLLTYLGFNSLGFGGLHSYGKFK